MALEQAKVFNIPPGVSFVRALAGGIVAEHGRDPLHLADIEIFVPTRRAARSLREAFVVALSGAALGPQVHALGDVDEEGFSLDPGVADLTILPAIAPLRRQFLLARLVQHWGAARDGAMSFVQGMNYANELARFLDEATTQGVDFSTLKDLAPAALAEHWQGVVAFLGIIAEAWPPVLAREAAIEPAARRDMLLRAEATRLKANPPQAPIYAAGSTGSIPVTAALLKTIAHLPTGAVVLPGLDTNLDESAWQALDPAHAQYGLRQLLMAIGIERADVRPWPGTVRGGRENTPRVRFLSEALRPPPTTNAWRGTIEKECETLSTGLKNLWFVEAANPREEAQLIAVALRDAVETPGRTAALVTPDRNLARRVTSELTRWNISIDDSAGRPLAHTPPGAFLTLLARAAAENFAPVALLALLKHPLAGGGRPPAEFRRRARELEYAVLRGVRPPPGLEGIAHALSSKNKADIKLLSWFEDLRAMFAPLSEAMSARTENIASLAEIHGLVAETLAATGSASGAAELWRGPAGETAAQLFADMIEHGRDVVLESTLQYAELFRVLAEKRAVRVPFGRHPRLSILGPLEARLQDFDFTILGGLNEGSWPQSVADDPWLSRPMRSAMGLDLPERRIGLAAHDFAALASSPNVLITRSLKQDGSPTIASRWWQRIKQLARGLQLEASLEPERPLLQWARLLDSSPRLPPAKRPSPTPPVVDRPRRLSVTEIETWLRDPYAIYARHVLKLRPLDAIDAEPGPRERGTAIHAAVERFFRTYPDAMPDNALQILMQMGEEAFAAAGTSLALLALWKPRFERAARWFLANDRIRRDHALRIAVEQRGELTLPGPQGPFTIRGRADRIDFLKNGGIEIIDYKSGGRIPGHNEVKRLLNPQLPLEAAMLLRDGFPGFSASRVDGLVYLQLTGGDPPGRERIIEVDPNEIAELAVVELAKLVARYDAPAQGYLSRFLPFSLTNTGDYDHLARVREWLVLGEGEE